MSQQSDDHSTANMQMEGHFFHGSRRVGALYYVRSSGILFRLIKEDGQWRGELCPGQLAKPLFEINDDDLLNKLVAFVLLSLAANDKPLPRR